MRIAPELLQMLAADVLDRSNLDPQLITDLAGRVSGLLARVRAIDAGRLTELSPAISFAAAHPGYGAARPDPAPSWTTLAASGLVGSGYGGTSGQTGTDAPQVTVTNPAPAPDEPGSYSTLADLASALRAREVSAVELAWAMLARARRLEPALNAFVTITEDLALAQARTADADLQRGEGGPLTGIPFALKDLYQTAGILTSCGSRVLADNVTATDATATVRLREAGAVLLGKAATHEFAFGPTTDSPLRGPTHNPWDLRCSPSGSSGGSGALVAAGVVPFALGTDTGGSIRMPAAVCGVVGLKPSYGRVSKFGVYPLSWSLDHAGPLCRTVADAAAVLQVLAGADPLDPGAAPVPVPDYGAAVADAARGLAGVRLGVPAGWLQEPLDDSVRSAFQAALRKLEELGAVVEEMELPPISVMVMVNRLITFCEAASFHAPLLAAHGDKYGPDVRARLEVGQFIPAIDYLTGQRLRTELARTVGAIMGRYDALLTPTSPIPAPRIGQRLCPWGETVPDALIRFTAPFSVTGQPAISIPMGFSPDGLPLGLQVVGRVMEEPALLRIAAAYEGATEWQRRRPAL